MLLTVGRFLLDRRSYFKQNGNLYRLDIVRVNAKLTACKMRCPPEFFGISGNWILKTFQAELSLHLNDKNF